MPILKWFMPVVAITLMSAFFLDRSVAAFCKSTVHGSWLEFFKWVSFFGKAEFAFIAFIFGAFISYFVARHRCRDFLWSICVLIFSGLGLHLIKWIVGRRRPVLEMGYPNFDFDPFQMHHSWQSFPSGHTQVAFALVGIVSWKFPSLLPVTVIYAILVALSRIVLQAHFLSDTIFATYYALLSVSVFQFLIHNRKFTLKVWREI